MKMKVFQKLKKLRERDKIQIPSTMTMAGSSIAFDTSYIDAQGQCFPMSSLVPSSIPKVITDEKIAECLSSVVESFEYYPNTGVVSVLDKDLAALALNKDEIMAQICNSLGVDDVEGMGSLARFADGKQLILKRSGLSGAVHKVVNGAFVSCSAVSTFTTTAASHVSGVTGLPLIYSTPGVIIFTPLIGGLFFGSLERLTAGTPVGTACGVARDVCLVVPRVAEITLNSVFPGPLLRLMNIDAPFNVSGYLRFGAAYEAVPNKVKRSMFAKLVAKLNTWLNES